MISLNVKHGRNSFDINIDASPTVDILQRVIEKVSGVPANNQTIIINRKKLKMTDDISNLTDKSKIILIGSKTTLKEPTKKFIFREDLTENEKSLDLPIGMYNLGNSCYMNSVVQIFFNIPEIRDKLIEYSQKEKYSKSGSNLLLVELGDLLSSLKNNGSAISPKKFLTYLLQAYPKFAEKDENQNFKQQDAEECFSLLLETIRAELKENVAYLFEGKVVSTTKCLEDENEPEMEEKSQFLILKCHISAETNYLEDGLNKSMTEHIMKRGVKSEKNMNWERKTVIVELPKYIIVHFVRFFWKKEIKEKAKIMRKVIFPVDQPLDLSKFCQNCSNTKYNLRSVITHQSPYANSGHFVAFCKRNQEWIMFDDDKVSVKNDEDIKGLYGGGEYHSAFLAIYEKME